MISEDAEQTLSVLIELATATIKKMQEDGKKNFEAQTRGIKTIGDTLASTLAEKLNIVAQNALEGQKKEVADLEARLKRLEASAVKANERVANSVASLRWRLWAVMLGLSFVVGFAGAALAVAISPTPSITLDAKELGAYIQQGMKQKK